jgi:DnaJ-class molecular chaperone
MMSNSDSPVPAQDGYPPPEEGWMLKPQRCPECHGTGDADQWDASSGPCETCWGEGEIQG